MAFDIEGKIVERLLRMTLPLWLLPYIVWFFGKRAALFVIDWVTKPSSPDRRQHSARQT